MPFALQFTATADRALTALENDASQQKRLKAVRKTLGLLQVDPRHSGLHTHKYHALSTREYEVFEAYAENRTPAAFRVFWRYGPGQGSITIIAITSHP